MPIRTGIPGGRRATEPEADPSISPGCASASPKVTPRLPARHRRPRASPAERLCPPARPRGAEPSGAGRGVRGWACGAGERRGRPPPASSPAEAAAPGRRRPRSPVSPVSPSSPAPPPPRSPHPTPPAPAPGEGAVGSRPPTQRPLFPADSPEVTRQGAAAAPHGHGERRRTRGAGGAQR